MSNQDETSNGSKKLLQTERLISALLHQPSLEKAAAAAGISVSTAYRLRQDPSFQEEYREARRQAVLQTIAHLQQGSIAASVALQGIMNDPKAPPASRIRAAELVIEHSRRLFEYEESQARQKQLEQTLAVRRPPPF
jgi:hypothetical protein